MIYALTGLILVAVAGALLALNRRLGRRLRTVTLPALPDDIDAYVREREGENASIRAGSEKQIGWHSPEKARSRYALVYIHGFSASPGELRPVPDRVASALGANLFYTRLAGHGMDGEALGRVQIEDWLDDVAEAIAIGERIGESVVVMATSTGAALATWALAQPPLARHIAGAVLFSPNYGLRARGSFLLTAPFARQIVHLVLGRNRSVEAVNDAHAHIWTTRYPTDALLPMADSIALANAVEFSAITVPVLIFYSPDDQIVDPAMILRTAARWGGRKAMIAVSDTEDASGHVLAGDALSPSTTATVVEATNSWLSANLPAQT
jgi:alpha-beta hydrolase superfamily lysophospholipase